MAPRKPIAEFSRQEFDALRERHRKAHEALRRDGSLLQSVARAYYALYATATFAAGKLGVRATHHRGKGRVSDYRFGHDELPDVIYALYTGLKRGKITEPGSSPGIGSGNCTEREATIHARELYRARLDADYGPTHVPEPLTADETDRLLAAARNVIRDLERFL